MLHRFTCGGHHAPHIRVHPGAGRTLQESRAASGPSVLDTQRGPHLAPALPAAARVSACELVEKMCARAKRHPETPEIVMTRGVVFVLFALHAC